MWALEVFLHQCQSSRFGNSLGCPCVPALCTVCSHRGVLISSSALRGSDSQLWQKRSTLILMNFHAVVVKAQRTAKVTYTVIKYYFGKIRKRELDKSRRKQVSLNRLDRNSSLGLLFFVCLYQNILLYFSEWLYPVCKKKEKWRNKDNRKLPKDHWSVKETI